MEQCLFKKCAANVAHGHCVDLQNIVPVLSHALLKVWQAPWTNSPYPCFCILELLYIALFGSVAANIQQMLIIGKMRTGRHHDQHFECPPRPGTLGTWRAFAGRGTASQIWMSHGWRRRPHRTAQPATICRFTTKRLDTKQVSVISSM